MGAMRFQPWLSVTNFSGRYQWTAKFLW